MQQMDYLMSITTFVFVVAELRVSTFSLIEERMLWEQTTDRY